MGLSKIRERHIFGGLPIQERGEKLLCGVAVVDVRSGRQCGLFEFTAGCEELYDVQFLPGVRRPMILNLQRPEVRQASTNPECCYWLRPSNETDSSPHTPCADMAVRARARDEVGGKPLPVGIGV